jgi:glutathione S-transferase
MKLYFSPGACSLSPHIALHEAGLPFTTEQVSLATKKTKSGADYRQINPKGYVPALELDGGELLTEGPAIVQYIADQKPELGLAPAAGTLMRYRLQEMLNYISTELHKAFGPLFNPKSTDEQKQQARETLSTKFALVSKFLDNQPFLLGDKFTVADGYLYTVLRWAKHVGLDLDKWPVIAAYFTRLGERPGVRAALSAEGLLSAKSAS